jgi:hypothetical protein
MAGIAVGFARGCVMFYMLLHLRTHYLEYQQMLVDLHAAHANQSDDRRTVITHWYQPDWLRLPERIQAQMARKTPPIPADWPAPARRVLGPMLASTRYRGSVEPCGRQLYRRK